MATPLHRWTRSHGHDIKLETPLDTIPWTRYKAGYTIGHDHVDTIRSLSDPLTATRLQVEYMVTFMYVKYTNTLFRWNTREDIRRHQLQVEYTGRYTSTPTSGGIHGKIEILSHLGNETQQSSALRGFSVVTVPFDGKIWFIYDMPFQPRGDHAVRVCITRT